MTGLSARRRGVGNGGATVALSGTIMPYRSTDKTRQKKDAKRTAIMQAAVKVFAAQGYHAATVRDIVQEAGVAIGTFYFYFPDKETLFTYLYEETADFLLQTLNQAVRSRTDLAQQVLHGIQAYFNIALYEPAVIQLLLVGGVGAVPALAARRLAFREQMADSWRVVLDAALDSGQIPDQNTVRVSEAWSGAIDEVVLNVLSQPAPTAEANGAIGDLVAFTLRSVAYTGSEPEEIR
jgi:AcrR family transcriptional regulator